MNSKTNMNNNDYIQILNYYKQHIPKSKQLIQTNAEKNISYLQTHTGVFPFVKNRDYKRKYISYN